MPPMPSPLVLVITAGITDLQPIVLTADGRRCRAAIKRNNRLFHEALLAGMPSARISVEQADETLPELELELPGSEGDLPASFDPELPLWLDREQQQCAEFERDGDVLVLVAPKLGHVWRWLQETGTPLAAALVFTTRRDADFRRFGREEPVAIGPLLTDWLRPLCREPESSSSLRIVEYLQGHEVLEDLQRGVSLSFAAARRIESGLRQLHDDHPDAPLMLAVSGGQPAAKEFVTAAASLYFPPERIHSALRTAIGAADSVAFARPGPAEAIRARRLALWHVRHGGFVEAHGMAVEFHDDPDAAPWVRTLEYAANLINRNVAIRSDPHVQPPLSLRKIAEYGDFRCVIPALRTEAALQGEHWPEAINWTMSFCDAILLDAIAKNLPVGARLQDQRQRIIWPNTLPLQPDAALLAEPYAAMQQAHGGEYKYTTTERWLPWVGSKALQDLYDAIRSGHPSPRAYRNINTHSRLTSQELENACRVFRQLGLWATEIDGPGTAFLDQALVRAAVDWVLPDGIDLGSRYRALIKDLEGRLLNPAGETASPPVAPSGFVAT